MIGFNNFNYIWIAIAVVTFLILVGFNIKAPYGRHSNNKWGAMISNKWGWFLMELPAFILMPALSLSGPSPKDNLTFLLIILWLIHYGFRTLIFPFKLKTNRKEIPAFIVLCALFFNGINGFLNGYYLGFLSQENEHILTLNVIVGIAIFCLGMFINRTSDMKLISLRENHDGYLIPNGGLFNYISCPNYFGEILEWLGFMLIAWNLPAATFFIWTISNLIPRSLNHHEWYLEKFKNYPKNRKAIIPFVW